MTWKDSQSRIIEFKCECGLLVQTTSRARKRCVHCSDKLIAERKKHVYNKAKTKSAGCRFPANDSRDSGSRLHS
jgi:hypothetical protein